MMEEYIEDGYASPTAQAQSEPDILLSIKHEEDEEDSAGGLSENKKFFELTPVELRGLQYEEPETFLQDDCEPPQHPPAAMPQQTETNTAEDRSSQQRRMPGRWTEDATLRFIKVYRQYDCLWDVKSPQYRNKAVRDQGFAALAASADLPGFTAADAKNKIKNLRSTYTQELRKVRASNGTYQPTLTWYREADAFLGPLIAPRMVTSDLQQQGVSGESEEVVMNEMEDTLEGSPTAAAPSPSSDRIPTSPSDTPSQHGNANKKRKKLATVSTTTYLSEDEFDAFGRSVAAQLKKFSLAGALRTQVKIQSLLTQERLSDSIHNLTCSCQQLEEPTANDILTQAVNSILPQD